MFLLTKYQYGLEWENSDYLQYKQLSEYIINHVSNKMVVKGLEKKKYCKILTPTVELVDLMAQTCLAIEKQLFLKSNHCCKHLNDKVNFTVKNFYLLNNYYMNYIRNTT